MARKILDVIFILAMIFMLIWTIIVDYVSINTFVVMWMFIFRELILVTKSDFKNEEWRKWE